MILAKTIRRKLVDPLHRQCGGSGNATGEGVVPRLDASFVIDNKYAPGDYAVRDKSRGQSCSGATGTAVELGCEEFFAAGMGRISWPSQTRRWSEMALGHLVSENLSSMWLSQCAHSFTGDG